MSQPSKSTVHTPVAPKAVVAGSECNGLSDVSCDQTVSVVGRTEERTDNTNKRKKEDTEEQMDEQEEYNNQKRKREDTKEQVSRDDSDTARTSPTKKSRGSHVKERPEMHETARSGQRHWAMKNQDLRKEWTSKHIATSVPLFEEQVQMCARSHIKSQHECLLRMLQITAIEGLIIPAQFTSDETKSFLGWTGFGVIAERSGEFRSRVEGLFEAKNSIKPNTINNAFRRAGLVPECWTSAWGGHAPFQYRPQKRAVYTHRSCTLRASPPVNPLQLELPAASPFLSRQKSERVQDTGSLWNLAVQTCALPVASHDGGGIMNARGGIIVSGSGGGAQPPLPLEDLQPSVWCRPLAGAGVFNAPGSVLPGPLCNEKSGSSVVDAGSGAARAQSLQLRPCLLR